MSINHHGNSTQFVFLHNLSIFLLSYFIFQTSDTVINIWNTLADRFSVHVVPIFVFFSTFLQIWNKKKCKAFNKNNFVSVFKYVKLEISIKTFVQKKNVQ